MKNTATPATLKDCQIATTRINRRSFLTRAMGTSTLVIGAALTVACDGDNKSESQDADVSEEVTHTDTTEEIEAESTSERTESGDAFDSH